VYSFAVVGADLDAKHWNERCSLLRRERSRPRRRSGSFFAYVRTVCARGSIAPSIVFFAADLDLASREGLRRGVEIIG
jgi:hypothetical protein